MKKQVFLMASLAIMMATIVNAQTRIGEINYKFENTSFLPTTLTIDGIARLITYDDDNNTITYYDNNLTPTELQIPENCASFLYYDYGTDLYPTNVMYSQTLFNNNAEYEYLRYTATDGSITKLEAVTESGTVLFSIEAPNNTKFGIKDNNSVTTRIYALTWGDTNYLMVGVMAFNSIITANINKYILYRINQQTQSITHVESGLPINVFPSVADRSQTITVELGEGNNATEVQVVNAMGQVVKSIAVQPGQREVQLRAADLGSGMHFVGARSCNSQGTCKIVIK